ncbi:hypothetical protein DFH07DRAFT_764409 [Mycena maculata]|uniref:Uncharacterized protein n=1 Tax=Mycena maculata TaxID=230809 RepID=A0AAD7KBJ6_9AGAR|nr:hypothetical protein DFH07DRAFT_764409 [Mycena maculata]
MYLPWPSIHQTFSSVRPRRSKQHAAAVVDTIRIWSTSSDESSFSLLTHPSPPSTRKNENSSLNISAPDIHRVPSAFALQRCKGHRTFIRFQSGVVTHSDPGVQNSHDVATIARLVTIVAEMQTTILPSAIPTPAPTFTVHSPSRKFRLSYRVSIQQNGWTIWTTGVFFGVRHSGTGTKIERPFLPTSRRTGGHPDLPSFRDEVGSYTIY